MGSAEIDEAIEALLTEQGSFAVRELTARTGRTRQALHGHLGRWLESGRLERTGGGRSVRYRRPTRDEVVLEHDTAGLSEADVWKELERHLDRRGPTLTDEARAILSYAVTELVNNAIDHSGAPTVTVRARLNPDAIEATVADRGVGAFESVRSRLGLDDELHALQELSKGKVTTQPDEHTGEGLFFTSKAVDRFELHANGLGWIVDNQVEDQAVLAEADRPGTTVRISVDPNARRPLEDVFGAYTTDFAFDRSRAVVRLFEHGSRFVSRSEAKRLAAGLERFREVLVDFEGVQGVGQGFVDELLRVWPRAHPETRLVPVNMNRAVEFMVRRGLG